MSDTGDLIRHFQGKTTSPDEILFGFYDWLEDKSIEPYPAQEQAFLEVMAGQHLILQTPTGSGKSLVGVSCHLLHALQGQRSVYTSPIKALVNEKFRDLCGLFGSHQVGLLTGDHTVNPDAIILCCTAEILASIAANQGDDAGIKAVVMDEFHYYADRQRGMAWQLPLLLLKKCQFVLMSATLGDTQRLETLMTRLTERETSLVESKVRPVPLSFSYLESTLQESVIDLIAAGRSPCYVVSFTHADVIQIASGLTSIAVLDKSKRAELKTRLSRVVFNTPFGKDLKRLLLAGIGVHYAGMLPRYRALVERLAQAGMLGVICGTDTLGVGINVPLRSVLFTQLCKYDGNKTRLLGAREFHQIAGRAGRKGFDDEGFVYAQAPIHVIENTRLKRKAEASGKKSSKVRLQKAPERGYAHWDKEKFIVLSTAGCEPLVPKFQIEHSLIVDLIRWSEHRHYERGGYGRLIRLIDDSDTTPRQKKGQRRRAKRLVNELIFSGLVVHQKAPMRRLVLAEDLQENFSVFPELTLFVVEATTAMGDDVDPLDLVSLVESVQENSMPILIAQRRVRRGEAIAEMKNDGVPYEERMEALEDIQWDTPPCEDQIRAMFVIHQARKPYLKEELLQPKHITRLLLETTSSINEFVRDYGLKRSEGLVVRYVSQTLKYLKQTIPRPLHSPALTAHLGTLETLVRQVDSSLIEAHDEHVPTQEKVMTPKLSTPAAQRQIRTVIQQGLRAWQARRFDGFADRFTDSHGEILTGEAVRKLTSPYEDIFGTFRLTPTLWDSTALIVAEAGQHTWTYRQHLGIDQADDDWYLSGTATFLVESDIGTLAIALDHCRSEPV